VSESVEIDSHRHPLRCDTLLGHFHLLFRGIQVEKCSAYVVVNLAANVLGFGFALSELSFGLGYVAFDRPPVKMGMFTPA